MGNTERRSSRSLIGIRDGVETGPDHRAPRFQLLAARTVIERWTSRPRVVRTRLHTR